MVLKSNKNCENDLFNLIFTIFRNKLIHMII